jgi:hypothetical protein
MEIRNRVLGLRMVKASELRANPMNWRRHPEVQRSALRGALAEIGFSGAVIAREVPEVGGYELLDGHLRAEESGDAVIPVLVVDLTEEEGRKLLASMDPIAAMAEQDSVILKSLLESVTTQDSQMKKLMESLADSTMPIPDPIAVDKIDEAKLAPTQCCPQCGFKW